MALTIDKETIFKYDVPGPRYTSYPTAPVWSADVQEKTYIEKLQKFGQSEKTLSLYTHLPFCKTMCTFCACNVLIRKDDEKYGDEYSDYLFKEIDLVARYIGTKKTVKQFHWGGGTPNFLNEAQIERLFKKVQENFKLDPQGEVAIEIDPRTISQNKMTLLRDLGFNRVSMGIQDFDATVQKGINRLQPFKQVEQVHNWCRRLKFHSINFDLIYGLPHQTLPLFKDTVSKVIALRPDRIALYSFAYVPWLKKHQNKIEPTTLPSNDSKLDIFLHARQQFLLAGYQAIAMDHFSLEDDELTRSFNEGKLYRNFMGYTVRPADEYIGLGLTSIGFLENTFIQNHKVLADYYGHLKENRLPVERGKVLTLDDRARQWVISSLMCHFKIDKKKFKQLFEVSFDDYFISERDHLKRCQKDNLLELSPDSIIVSELGKIFIRNICMGFDHYLQEQKQSQKFSRTV